MNSIAKRMLMERLDGERDERRTRDYDRYERDERRMRDYDRDERARDRRGRFIRDRRAPYDYRGWTIREERDGRYDDARSEYRRGSDYREDDRRDYAEDYDRDERYGEYRRDYHDDEPLKIKERDMKEWEHKFQNADGTSGVKFKKEQVQAIAKQEGVTFDKFSLDELFLATNMIYSDYCVAARKFGVDRPDFYVCIAKAFLCDDDFDGEPSEKLAMYYYCIVDGE